MLGNNNGQNSNSNNKPYEPTVYSNYKFSGENSVMSFSYWNSFLRISIIPLIKDSQGNTRYDTSNEAYISLNHTKAYMLAELVKDFWTNHDVQKPAIVTFGNTVKSITIERNTNGSVSLAILYFGASLDSNIERKINFTIPDSPKVYYDNNGKIEEYKDYFANHNTEVYLHQLYTILMEYYKAMSNALAYSVLNQFKWSDNRQYRSLKAISDKLGIGKEERTGNNSNGIFGSNTTANSYSNNNPADYDDYE